MFPTTFPQLPGAPFKVSLGGLSSFSLMLTTDSQAEKNPLNKQQLRITPSGFLSQAALLLPLPPVDLRRVGPPQTWGCAQQWPGTSRTMRAKMALRWVRMKGHRRLTSGGQQRAGRVRAECHRLAIVATEMTLVLGLMDAYTYFF